VRRRTLSDDRREETRPETKDPGRVKVRLPLTLPLLPGLRWRGKLRVMRLGKDGSADVEFDAEIVHPDVQDRFVFDRTTLTAKQLADWTGWRMSKEG